jgi:hypothetical protein
MVDFTKFVYDQLTQGATPNKVSVMAKTFGGSTVLLGEALMHKCPVSPLEVARSIAYDAGMGHEIVSYTQMSPGGHNSSFSPEDLCSNFLGTLIAERAINAGGNFDAAVTRELNALIRDLNGQSKTETRRAFDLINGRWVDWSSTRGIVSLNSDSYLKRRNFARMPFHAGHSSDATVPAYVVAPMRALQDIYTYTHKEGGANLRRSSFDTETTAIKTDARQRYGPDFDKP